MRHIALAVALFASPGMALGASLSVRPEAPIQGEPLMVTVEGAPSASVKALSIDGGALKPFDWQGAAAALYGIDLNKRAGTSTVSATLADGTVLRRDVYIGERKKATAPLGIPESLGGNTATSAAKLVSTLAQENATLLGLRTGTHAFWKEPFRYPVADPVVTDAYGYSRDTVGYSITHKGTDFKAKEGTPVLAMNRGVVRLAQTGRNYGKTVVVDHGLGVQTLYLHLSRIDVNVGELVLPGQRIGLSGSTGYASGPHLHVSARIGEVSIDPEAFLALFK